MGRYSHATRGGGLIFVSGQGAFDPETGRIVDGGIREQTSQVLRNISLILQSAGADLSSVVKVTVFLHAWKDFAEMNEVYASFFPAKARARSTVQGERWPEGSLVAIEAIALVPPEH
ncbi:Rid family detoxifying hydrolase [Deinococcus deserti]|uniref:Rid family detoxifying hydrolase n=1 Tax=Deinococcus deserti TaxID=310783 RepID=UPI0030841D77